MSPRPPQRPQQPPPEAPEVVDPRWLLQAAGAVAALGLVCAYLTLCGFFYWGQWQFVLHPSRVVSTTPASAGLGFEGVRFGDNLAGQPQLTGWWVPTATAGAPAVLLLHGATGSIGDVVAQLAALHQADLNVLVIDYRGYGQSGGSHPTEASMRQDSEAARRYLVETRHMPEARIVVAGVGLGASLAVQLSGSRPDLPGLILIDADGDTLSRVQADQRSRILPIGLLFHERFPLADQLAHLKTPKLLISLTQGQAPEIVQRAAEPKITAELPAAAGLQGTVPLVRRFIDQIVPR